MTLSIRWKVMIGALLVLACGLLIARELVVRSLDQQEIVQSGLILEARTSLVAYGLQPFLTRLESNRSGCNVRRLSAEDGRNTGTAFHRVYRLQQQLWAHLCIPHSYSTKVTSHAEFVKHREIHTREIAALGG